MHLKSIRTRNALLLAAWISLFFGCSRSAVIKANSSLSADSISASNTAVSWLKDNIGISDSLVIADTLLRNDDSLFACGTFICLPIVHSKTGKYEVLNHKIVADFDLAIKVATANPKPNKDEYHKISYDYYLHDSILTIKITDRYAWHLSEAITAYSVYHFDTGNNKLLTSKDMFAAYGMSQVPVLSAFAEQCTMPPDHTEPLYITDWFNKVKWKDLNLLKFYTNNEQKTVIIYPLAENGLEAEQILE